MSFNKAGWYLQSLCWFSVPRIWPVPCWAYQRRTSSLAGLRSPWSVFVGTFHLIQFKEDIQKEAKDAPTFMQREPAREVLDQLSHPE